jgi:hypothetical protein
MTPLSRTRRIPKRREAARLRALAAECRDIARSISLRPDRERLLDMAREHEAIAAKLEAEQAAEQAAAADTETPG